MSKSKVLLDVKCDVCGAVKFSTNFVFKRHLHFCYLKHGIAANNSSTRDPRKKIERAKDLCVNNCEDHTVSKKSDSSSQSLVENGREEQDMSLMETIGSEMEKLEDDKPSSSKSLGWSVSNSPKTETLKSKNKNIRLEEDDMETDSMINTSMNGGALIEAKNKINRKPQLGQKEAEFESVETEAEDKEHKKVKPLKLKRLHVKTPFFQVSHESKMENKESQESPPMSKNIFKMVLSADGSHTYQCRDCLYYADTAMGVKKHHNLCHNKCLQCSYCEFNTYSQADFYEHIVTHEGSVKASYIKCPDCIYVTTVRPNYEKHRSFHGADCQFKCKVCNFASDSVSVVKRHMATQHLNRINEDEDGKHLTSGNRSMESTLNVSTGDKSQENWKSLKKDGTGKGQAKDVYHMIRYKCPLCTVVCLRRSNLTRHLVNKHNYDQEKSSLTTKNLERQLLRKRKLGQRRNKTHPAKFPRSGVNIAGMNAGAMLKCTECSYSAKWPSDLRRHQHVHTVVKRYKCSMCPNKYKYHGDLNVHMRRDHLMEPLSTVVAENVISNDVVRKSSPVVYRCPICGHATRSKADLDKHSKQHGELDKKFQCRRCNYQTYWRGDVSRHLVKHHQIHLSREGTELTKHFIVRSDSEPFTRGLDKGKNGSIPSEDMDAETDRNILKTNNSSQQPLGETPGQESEFGQVKEGMFVCSRAWCDYKTFLIHRLETHNATHENLKRFACPTCGKRSNYKYDVVKHMNRVHSKPSATAKSVITMSIEEAKATIDLYNFRFKSGRKMETTFHVKPVKFSCSLCEFYANEKNIVSHHLNLCHKNESSFVITMYPSVLFSEKKETRFVEPPPEKLENDSSPYACAICHKLEELPADVKKHYSEVHPLKEVRVLYKPNYIEFNPDTLIIYATTLSPPPHLSNKQVFVQPDSKLSHPKMHGYVKPFKCSICGLRSNWKWDLKKHLRTRHPEGGGFVIMLSLEEAKLTYGTDCTLSHPHSKNEGQQDTSRVYVKEESHQVFPDEEPRGMKGISTIPTVGKGIEQSSKLWKCSACAYVTHWRRNIARHISRKHMQLKELVKAIPIPPDDIKDYKPPFSYRSPAAMSVVEKSVDKEQGRIWQCPQCPFRSTFKTHIIIHMQKHGMHPFMCVLCNAPFMFRGSLHQHLQRFHNRQDYISLVKLDIQYDLPKTSKQLRQDIYRCLKCSSKFESKDKIVTHLKNAHQIENFDQGHFVVISKSNKNDVQSSPENKTSIASSSSVDDGPSPNNGPRSRKMHYCQLCPFHTPNRQMLMFHMTYHKSSSVNRLKCKHCSYHNSTIRLLNQHMKKWHADVRRPDAWEEQLQNTSRSDRSGSIGNPKKHMCDKCPYTANCKNSIYYHKQFHRPRKNAVYKCECCDYWVEQKRLLKQHMHLHEQGVVIPENSPPKPVYTDSSMLYDPVEMTELAALKQQMISAKVMPSLSGSPKISPMKLASRCSIDNKPGFVLKGGVYRKLHKCPKCPYTNIRLRNINLHVLMHGPRESDHPLLKCPYCDYYVGSKGLLSHHMKVHQKSYGDTPEKDALTGAEDDGNESDDPIDIQTQQKVDTLLQISRMKRFGCEKCPYASARRQHFERHLELHGSRQRYTCQFCDYSVPSSYLLTQHSRLHLMPNQNLLLSQSVNSLQHLSGVPADIALASALPPSDSDMGNTISVIHDHLGLYENSIYDPDEKKLYRCDRCPYANMRRDYLLSHLKFHMVTSAFVCPYCDYSAPKQPLLTQHIRVHFCPLPELSEWLLDNGQTEREMTQRNLDLDEALQVADEYQQQAKTKTDSKVNVDERENIKDGENSLVCQYCDREFAASDKLMKHELQHLIGNQFSVAAELKRNEEDKISRSEEKGENVSGLVRAGDGEEKMEVEDSSPVEEQKEDGISAEIEPKPEVLIDIQQTLEDGDDKSGSLEVEMLNKEIVSPLKENEIVANSEPKDCDEDSKKANDHVEPGCDGLL